MNDEPRFRPDPNWRPSDADVDEMQTRYEERMKNARVGELGRFGVVTHRFNNLTIQSQNPKVVYRFSNLVIESEDPNVTFKTFGQHMDSIFGCDNYVADAELKKGE